MNFGIPKELPIFRTIPESRVGLSPMGVRELVEYGAKVYVENDAGKGAGFSNTDYDKAGAEIVYSKAEAYKRADVVLKVRPPKKEEYGYIKPEQTLMGFFHLVTAPKDLVKLFVENKNVIIGYEIIQKENGELPIVIPMSEIAGKLAVQIAGRLLESPNSGRGVLLGSIPGIPPAEVVILGAGTLGQTAAKTFAGVGANVYILDIKREKLEEICRHLHLNITTLHATKQNIEKMVKFADVLIGAVLVPGERAPVLVTKEMVASMKKGAAIIDLSIDQGGCIEASKVTPCGEFNYAEYGVQHFCMPTATTLVARTATKAMTCNLIPYLEYIAKYGVEESIEKCTDIKRGMYLDKGTIKKEYLK